ncbi:hypothetical protein BDV12DRAFT_203440 [Aspergillus spectabilis]
MPVADDRIIIYSFDDNASDKDFEILSEAKWRELKTDQALDRLQLIRRHEPSPEVQTLYNEAGPSVKRLISNPEDMEALEEVKKYDKMVIEITSAKGQEKTEDPEHPDKEGTAVNSDKNFTFRINYSLIQQLAKQANDSIACMDKDPHDFKERKKYEMAAITLQKEGDINGWPKEWQVRPLPEFTGNDTQRKFYPKAWPAISVLQKDPGNEEAITDLNNINLEIIRHASKAMEMDTSETLQINAPVLRGAYGKFRQLILDFQRDTKDTDSLRLAGEVNGALKKYLKNFSYPQSWALEIPHDIELGKIGARAIILEGERAVSKHLTELCPEKSISPPPSQAKTRMGAMICAYRINTAFGRSGCYYFAILPEESRIGEIRTGWEIGDDAKNNYLGGKPLRVRPRTPEDKQGFKELLSIFIRREGTRNETWAIFSQARMDQVTNVAMNFTNYKQMRGTDAFYDIADLYKKSGIAIEPCMARKFPNNLEGSLSRLIQGSRDPLRNYYNIAYGRQNTPLEPIRNESELLKALERLRVGEEPRSQRISLGGEHEGEDKLSPLLRKFMAEMRQDKN